MKIFIHSFKHSFIELKILNFQDLYNIYTLIPSANLTSLIISACSLGFLIVFKILLHPRLEKLVKRKINISYELILVSFFSRMLRFLVSLLMLGVSINLLHVLINPG